MQAGAGDHGMERTLPRVCRAEQQAEKVEEGNHGGPKTPLRNLQVT
jgi:hypothetical protein